MLAVDMWYGDNPSDVTRLDVYWADVDCVYRGNIYIGSRMVGDYTANTVQELERRFTKLEFREL